MRRKNSICTYINILSPTDNQVEGYNFLVSTNVDVNQNPVCTGDILDSINCESNITETFNGVNYYNLFKITASSESWI